MLHIISDFIVSATVILLVLHVNLLARRQKQLLDRLDADRKK